MYPVGFPLWRWAVRCGMTPLLHVQVQLDAVAGGYCATSTSLPGLLVRARTRECLIRNVYVCAGLLLADELGQALQRQPLIAWDGIFQDSPAPSLAWRHGARQAS